MKVRQPDYDFSRTDPLWCREHPEFAQRTNLGSLSLPYLEPYLNVVMRQAQAKLGPDHALNAGINLFCKQEANHYLQHGAFNATLHRAGYEKVGEIEALFKNHFERLLREKSLKYNLAYTLGFETLGPISSVIWFEHNDELVGNADQTVVAMWKWHHAEELEHRTVAYDVYQTLYGGYFGRIYGLYAFLRDWKRISRKTLDYLLAETRRGMSAAELEASKRRLAEIEKRELRLAWRGIVYAFSPSYSPRKLRLPHGVGQFLQTLDRVA
jgi:predicted metal-dependent hydrolase